MKKSVSLEQDSFRQPRSGGIRKAGRPAGGKPSAVKLSPALKREPVGLLEERGGDSEVHPVRFDYFNPAAREVMVAGSFNAWQPRATRMTREPGGRWSAKLLLQPGLYEYRFVVDGQWQDDPMAVRFASNPFGGTNCVLEVEPGTTVATGPP